MTARRGAWIAGAIVTVCVAILLADYVVAARRSTRDENRITVARLARKRRDDSAAWVLIGAAALFLTYAKRTVRGRIVTRAPVSNGRRTWVGDGAASRPTAPPIVEIDLAFVDDAVARLGGGEESAILLLQAIQAHYRYLPDEALRRVCQLTEITPAQIAGTSSFYARFRRTPVGAHIVRVCHGTACHVSGARQITDELRRYLEIPDGADTDPARQFTIDEVACLGCCSLAPVLLVDGHPAGKLTPATACAAVREPV